MIHTATAITGINTGETLALGTVDDRFAEVLETAGVPLTVALNNSQEPMSRMAAALETYNSNPVVFQSLSTPAGTPAQTPVIPAITSAGIAGSPQAGTSATGAAQPIVLNPTFYIQLDDGSLAKVEGRMALRSDQGLSVLEV